MILCYSWSTSTKYASWEESRAAGICLGLPRIFHRKGTAMWSIVFWLGLDLNGSCAVTTCSSKNFRVDSISLRISALPTRCQPPARFWFQSPPQTVFDFGSAALRDSIAGPAISASELPAPWGWPGLVQQTVQIAASRNLTLIVRDRWRHTRMPTVIKTSPISKVTWLSVTSVEMQGEPAPEHPGIF